MATQTQELDLAEVLRQVAHEKDIDMTRWVSALEDAMASGGKKGSTASRSPFVASSTCRPATSRLSSLSRLLKRSKIR